MRILIKKDAKLLIQPQVIDYDFVFKVNLYLFIIKHIKNLMYLSFLNL